MAYTKDNFSIVENLSTHTFVIKSEGIRQEMDFEKGGLITSRDRAEEIRDLLIQRLNNPPPPSVPVEQTVSEMKVQVANNSSAVDFIMFTIIPTLFPQ
jgi:hypothetical protein